MSLLSVLFHLQNRVSVGVGARGRKKSTRFVRFILYDGNLFDSCVLS